jgi:hypothetical protein
MPSATPAGWQPIADGVHTRYMIGYEASHTGPVYVLRLDPARVDLRLRYDPRHPRPVSGWFAAELPLAAVNAGFFDPDGTPVGLWVIDDVEFGRGYHRIQGELRISGAGVSIRRMSERYLSDGTRIIASIESFPFLLTPGGIVNPCLTRTSGDELLGRRSRPCASLRQSAERMAVGIDRAGQVIFLLAPTDLFTFRGMADWLKNSDLNLDVALNLDGGSSAGMIVQAGAGTWGEDSGREVPGAIVVLPKVLGIDNSGSP